MNWMRSCSCCGIAVACSAQTLMCLCCCSLPCMCCTGKSADTETATDQEGAASATGQDGADPKAGEQGAAPATGQAVAATAEELTQEQHVQQQDRPAAARTTPASSRQPVTPSSDADLLLQLQQQLGSRPDCPTDPGESQYSSHSVRRGCKSLSSRAPILMQGPFTLCTEALCTTVALLSCNGRPKRACLSLACRAAHLQSSMQLGCLRQLI